MAETGCHHEATPRIRALPVLAALWYNKEDCTSLANDHHRRSDN